MDKKKMTEEELYKHVDALLEGLDSSDVNTKSEDGIETKADDKTEEVEVEIEAKADDETTDVEKAYKKGDKKDDKEKDNKDDGDEDDEEKEVPPQFEKKKDKKKKEIKKAVEVDEDEYNELLAKAEKLEDLTKTEEVDEENTLKKAMSEISDLKKSIENLKKSPAEKKSVDGLEVIQKGNNDDKDKEKKSPKNILKGLTRSKVANIMVEDLIMKSVDGVSTQDVCEYEANGCLSNKTALDKTLEAVNKRHNDGIL